MSEHLGPSSHESGWKYVPGWQLREDTEPDPMVSPDTFPPPPTSIPQNGRAGRSSDPYASGVLPSKPELLSEYYRWLLTDPNSDEELQA